MELAGLKLQKVDLDLGEGADLLKLSTDDSVVKLRYLVDRAGLMPR